MRSISFVDSNYAINIEDRRSITGMINTLGGMITNWTSKAQPTVSLSSTEAEYMALASCAQETMFTNSLLTELGSCKRPGIIKEDNTGAIFLVKNKQVSARTKHIDVRHHYVRELREKGEVEVEFVRGRENVSDGMTKNLPTPLFKEHTSSILNGLNATRESVKLCE